MTPDLPPTSRSSLGVLRDSLIVGAIVVLGLYAGAGFLIPLTVALLVYVLIITVSDRITAIAPPGLPVPRWLADLTGVAVVLSGLSAIMFVLASQATQFARALPGYEAQFDSALDRVTALIGSDIVALLRDMLVGIDMSLVARGAFGGATSLLSSFLLIFLYVAFMMAERTAMARKILMAAGDPRLGEDLAAMMETIAHSLQSYVSVKTFVSALTALISYVVYRTLGLDFPETWAVLTFALNFIPSLGSVVAVVFPALVALVQFDSAAPFLVIVLFLGTVQFLIGNFLDPAMLGRSLNLSSFMVILALTFWTAVWGLIGAFLSVPLTMCILIVFSQIPALRPVAIVMSKDGRLLTAADQTDTMDAPEGGQ